jgi:hypothetical protein
MAVFGSEDSSGPIRFDHFNLADLFAGTPRAGNTDAVFAIGPSDSTFTAFNGTGFTYSGGLFTGGTINRIDSVVANHTEFVFLDINMPVAQFPPL